MKYKLLSLVITELLSSCLFYHECKVEASECNTNVCLHEQMQRAFHAISDVMCNTIQWTEKELVCSTRRIILNCGNPPRTKVFKLLTYAVFREIESENKVIYL